MYVDSVTTSNMFWIWSAQCSDLISFLRMELPMELPDNLPAWPADPAVCNTRQAQRGKKRRNPSTVLPAELPSLEWVPPLEHAGNLAGSLPDYLPAFVSNHGIDSGFGAQQVVNSAVTVKFGGDFSGMEVAWEAAVEVAAESGRQINLQHIFSSDCDVACRRTLAGWLAWYFLKT